MNSLYLLWCDSRTKGNVYLYLFTRVTDDIETQRKGVVFLLWPGPADVQFTFPDRQEHIRKLYGGAVGETYLASCPCSPLIILLSTFLQWATAPLHHFP